PIPKFASERAANSGELRNRDTSMLTIDELCVRVAGRLLVDRASVQIPTGARVGIVGRNGAGKTSVFRAICGDIAIESGTIALAAGAPGRGLPPGAPGGPE